MGHEDWIFRRIVGFVDPLIEASAKRFAGSLRMTRDEARQEARFALLLALRRFDYNASHGLLYRFCRIALRNHFLRELSASRKQIRYPHTVWVDERGKRVAVPLSPAEAWTEFSEADGAVCQPPDAALEEAAGREVARRLQGALEGLLDARDREVLKCKLTPPLPLQMRAIDQLLDRPTDQMIGAHLGLSRNVVNWSLRRIRNVTIKLIARDFVDLTGLAIVKAQISKEAQ